MKSVKTVPPAVAIGLWLVLLFGAACGDDLSTTTTEPSQPAATSVADETPAADENSVANENTGGADDDDGSTVAVENRGDSAVTGTVTYRERIALPPDSVVEMELHDVTLIDGPSRLIARQIITDPGQVPIPFRLEYDRSDIRPENTYAVQARIKHGDGSLAFINDTAYEVITQGRPSMLDMVLVMAGPPPDPDAEMPDVTLEGDWVVIPAEVIRARVEADDGAHRLTVTYHLPGGEDCSRLEGSRSELVDIDIYATVNILEKRAPDGAAACATPPREQDVALEVGGPLAPGETYRVRVNDHLIAAFTPPREALSDSHLALSPIESAELVILEMDPPKYNVVVTSALPKGSSCSQFNGFTIERSDPDRIDILITHHETSDTQVPCTEDYPMVDTTVPLGSDFESGKEYTVTINDYPPIFFQAQ